MGVFPLFEAVDMARKRGLDLVQVTEKVDPPVCRITDYGKFVYWEKKKEKEKHVKSASSEFKGIRLKFGISSHDMEVKARSAVKFLNKGNKVRIELPLRGRQKSLADFAKEKITSFLEILEKEVPFKVERELKQEGRGLMLVIAKIDK